MEQRRFPRWPLAILVSLGLAGAFVAMASAIEGSNNQLLFAKAKEACAIGADPVAMAHDGGSLTCKK